MNDSKPPTLDWLKAAACRMDKTPYLWDTRAVAVARLLLAALPVVEAAMNARGHARTMRRSRDLTGPVEYQNDPRAMKIWCKALYQEGKGLDRMLSSALAAFDKAIAELRP